MCVESTRIQQEFLPVLQVFRVLVHVSVLCESDNSGTCICLPLLAH